MSQFCWAIPLYSRNSFKINGEIIQSLMRYSQRVTNERQRNANERSGRCGEKERARERKVEKARKTKKSKRICDLAAARTRPSRLPTISPIAGFFVVVRRCRWDRSRREKSIVGDYGKPPVSGPEADQRCRLLRWRSDPREIITRPSVRPFRPDGPVSFAPVYKTFSASPRSEVMV